ncbi:uncharacterized protein LOC117103828 [Anneissia japonica]|uniref:uncharacterized protein LOC117103828 n=1 Tax=Anneissia japonica TaxID=1529436 RepID=UPI0014259A59|nr:uncharacterized protein LOC117103828 [Anneissia japonica]
MSLLCYKNCRDSAMLLGMPTDQMLKKRVFKGKKHPQDKSEDNDKDDPPYSPWDEKNNMEEENEENAFGQPSRSTSSSSSKERIPISSLSTGYQSNSQTNESPYDSDAFSQINLYSREVMDVMNAKNDGQQNGKSADEKKTIGLLDKIGREISSLLKRSDKKSKDEPVKRARPNTNGYDGGESESDTQSNVSVAVDTGFWSIHYGEKERLATMHSPQSSEMDEFNLSSVNSEFGRPHSIATTSGYERSSRDGSFVRPWRTTSSMVRPSENDIVLNRYQRGIRSPVEYYGTEMDTQCGLKRMHYSTTNLPLNGSQNGTLNRYWSEQNIMREPMLRRRDFSGKGNERKYASAENLTDKSYSSGDANMKGPGSVTRYRLSFVAEPVKKTISSGKIEPITITPRRDRSEERLMRTIKKQNFGMTSTQNNDRWSTSSNQSDQSKLTLNVDFDYRADSSRLYVILKSVHGLPPLDKGTGKTNVRVHLVVMPERVQRAYSRRKNEGWTIRFMEKFRFSNINTLNSIVFKVVLNDGSTKERLIGTTTIHMKGIILSKRKQSFTVEINANNNN